MHRVTLIPTVRRTLFGPRVTIFTKDGRSFTREGTGREFIWDFEEQARRIQPVAPGLAITGTQFADADRYLPQPRSHRPCGSPTDRADHSASLNRRYCRSNFTTRRTRPHSPGCTT